MVLMAVMAAMGGGKECSDGINSSGGSVVYFIVLVMVVKR